MNSKIKHPILITERCSIRRLIVRNGKSSERLTVFDRETSL